MFAFFEKDIVYLVPSIRLLDFFPMSAVRNASESAYVRHERSGLNRLEIASYTDYLHLLQHGSFEKLTMLDLYSLSGLKREEMRNLLYTTYQDPKHGARM